ncbi:MAG: SIS domain-containing protein [Deltaproteobacteria bacterium]|nr:SIS domain-containing protein [Deltaproteobacteria bacterium]
MCGVIGLIYQEDREDLGRIAAELLRTLEYRGYDSTGAVLQGREGEYTLRKGVGAPSAMVDRLGITAAAGHILCGQVRWATFGAVDERNAQPHTVACKTAIYGAHNGNVTNCDELKIWLQEEGHNVKSDNDGEMLIHTVEHFFAHELSQLDHREQDSKPQRTVAMRKALLRAAERLRGSYAAVIVDPVTHQLWALKQGSSLYFGVGRDEQGGAFAIASSDLSAVLKLTQVLVPLAEGEAIEFEPDAFTLFQLVDQSANGDRPARTAGQEIERPPVRSRLRAEDTALSPEFEFFMDQEIHAQQETCNSVVQIYLGGSEAHEVLEPYIRKLDTAAIDALKAAIEGLRSEVADETILPAFQRMVDGGELALLLELIPDDVSHAGTELPAAGLAKRLVSSDAGFFTDLLTMARHQRDSLGVRIMDVVVEREEVREFQTAVRAFAERVSHASEAGGRIFVISCGTSYNAAKAGALFFNEIARTELIPILPGEFRAQYAKSLRDDDLFIAISQSGETKDVIDVLNDARESGKRIEVVALVNNVNSTLGQEKAQLVVPLRCGPEIAVPATKSFINQMTLLYCLALEVANHRLYALKLSDDERQALSAELDGRRERLPRLPLLIRETFDSTETDIEAAAKLLYLAPSIHILATRITAVAKEGALKVREVVLNHTEGIEGSEFKHGPNTILGHNTVYGPLQVDRLLRQIGETLEEVLGTANAQGIEASARRRIVQAICESVFSPTRTALALSDKERELLGKKLSEADLKSKLTVDYPLIYITGPNKRDVALTISQINTHKIRGASTVVIAEESAELRSTAEKAPTTSDSYHAVYITLPRTEDTLMTVFSSTIVLQRLALKMSTLKMRYLDRIGVRGHGVHPDVPKNVSKSITVD